MIDENATIQKTADFIKKKFATESTGHDWWHMYRVWQLAKRIASREKGANLFVVELAALLHDIEDWKFHGGNTDTGPIAARKWLKSLKIREGTIRHVENIIQNVSFKGAKVKNNLDTIEGQIVHDADKLDALGAVGIARCFAFGGSVGNVIYDPARKPTMHVSFDEYKKMDSSSVTHFYEKLLLLKDRMYTKTGKKMAIHRHKLMENYLDEFYKEWDGEI